MSKLTADNIRLRAAVPTDIPSIATLLASAPDDGSKYQFPHILEYAGDMVNLHMQWLCHSMRDEDALIMLAIASSEKVLVFATGEARGVGFYEKAMGFQKISGSEYWLDQTSNDVSEDEVRNGSTAWTTEEEGLTGAHVLWLPDGVSIP